MGEQRIEPVFHVRFEVIAYDEGGYGDNRSRDFNNGQEAVEYARSLEKRFGPTVWKRITMEPISVRVPHEAEAHAKDTPDAR